MNPTAVKAIRYYQIFSRTIFRQGTGFFIMPVACRQYPTCSDYAIDAFGKHNFLKAAAKSLLRIIKCNPWTAPSAEK